MISMQPTTNFLINASRKAAQLLYRDFCELEMLQISSRSTYEFYTKSYLRTKTLLAEELQKHSRPVFFADEKFELTDKFDTVFLVNPLDSIDNLARSFPFFAITITCLKKVNRTLTPAYSIINFPALGDILYAEKGGGAWIEKNIQGISNKNVRLRTSSTNSIENALIITDDAVRSLQISPYIRCFGSPCYSLMLFSAGKSDCIWFSQIDSTLKLAFELVVRESGGFIIADDSRFIASNHNLADKFKQLLIKNTV